MITQNYPLFTAWCERDSTAKGEQDKNGGWPELTQFATETRQVRSGRVIGWWTIPGDVTAELVPVVIGPGDGRAFPVADQDAVFFYGDEQAEAVGLVMNYQLRETGGVWLG
jgi:hypothetical protein